MEWRPLRGPGRLPGGGGVLPAGLRLGTSTEGQQEAPLVSRAGGASQSAALERATGLASGHDLTNSAVPCEAWGGLCMKGAGL